MRYKKNENVTRETNQAAHYPFFVLFFILKEN